MLAMYARAISHDVDCAGGSRKTTYAVAKACRPDAHTPVKNLAMSFDHHNECHPHNATLSEFS